MRRAQSDVYVSKIRGITSQESGDLGARVKITSGPWQTVDLLDLCADATTAVMHHSSKNIVLGSVDQKGERHLFVHQPLFHELYDWLYRSWFSQDLSAHQNLHEAVTDMNRMLSIARMSIISQSNGSYYIHAVIHEQDEIVIPVGHGVYAHGNICLRDQGFLITAFSDDVSSAKVPKCAWDITPADVVVGRLLWLRKQM